MFEGMGLPLSEAGLAKAAGDIGIGLPALWAVMTVETKGCGFLRDRRPLILFERHVFHKRTNGRFDATAPDLSDPDPGGYGAGGPFQHDRLARAIALDRRAALESASWGLGQVMGYNAASVGFADVEAMARAMSSSEDAQFQGMVGFITANKLSKFLQQGDWENFASRYNGPGFKKNRYDEKLAAEHARYVKGPLPGLRLRAAQLLLTYRGFNPGPVDGWFGKRTKGALAEFQKARNLPATGELDDATFSAMESAAG
ncbi:N-acetylmuramidase domain-containing protein [Polaromonas sp. P2-4]|nr:N-acetylmuramidase domain-containing protein [Polaromonas sp. P2-4]